MTRNKYIAALKDPRWQKKRLRIMERDGFKCRKCQDSRTTLNVHHLRYSGGKMPWDYEDEFLATLCENCHESVEHERSMISILLVDNGVFELFKAIRKFHSKHGANFICATTSVVESVGHALDRKDKKQADAVNDSCHGIDSEPPFHEDKPVSHEVGRNFFAAMRAAASK